MISKKKLSKIFKELNLMNYINQLNEAAQKDMDADPNLWIGKLSNDPDHWAEYGVYTPASLELYLDAECQNNLAKEERYI
jgi:hypothetical protein